MEQNTVIWVLIALALFAANAPFVSQRLFIALPWALPTNSARPAWLRVAEFIAFFALVAFWLWLARILIASAPPVADLASAGSFFIRVLVVTLAAIVLLALPGWRTTLVGSKPVYVRFLELIL